MSFWSANTLLDQQLLELRACAVQAGLHRPEIDLQRLGDLLVLEAVELAQHAAPLPTMQQFRERVGAALGSPHDPGEEERQQQELLRQYKVDKVSDLPVNWSGISLARGEDHGNRVFDAHYGDLFARLQRQSDAIAAAGWRHHPYGWTDVHHRADVVRREITALFAVEAAA